MSTPSSRATPGRRRGRPAASAPRLDAAQIVSAALAALEAGQADVSMRGLAAALGVDPMALYHYFPSKQALVDALIDQAFAPLDGLAPRLARLPDRMQRLQRLAQAYLRCVTPLPQLTRQLARHGGGRLAARFATLFEQACGQPVAPDSPAARARDVLVDYLHGAALSGPKSAERALAAGWPLLWGGLQAAL